MSTIWEKPDGKCHHCKKDLPIESGEVLRVLWMEFDTGYVCAGCDEVNAWQDPKVGKFMSFIMWLGRKYF